ncbi:DNA primase [endosymbiont GvMRE of Glomus versiforme]|uniref:DNA primase n=1 Tax=endosymbiont GvMRE of Glomus versiforme TaxID=2039283 RepID=UPI000EEE3A0F|nr:DNA primase [endosymbiont GvMRE of Glomus versiforme]RHZ37232.1 DNA primase [endosymbiont GvMRE of Glomus versiforme]
MDQKDLLPLSTENILQLLKRELRLSFIKKGKDYFVSCPFHQEKSPSFTFEPEKKIFKCFGCGFGAGNIFKLWTQMKKISVIEAKKEIKQLGYQVGSEENWLEQEEISKEKKLFSLVTTIYQHNLFSVAGKKALAYLKQKRQINKETIQQFGFGCSVNHRQLTNLFSASSEDAEHLLLTNLLRSKENSQIIDFFTENQLIIPLQNEKGEIVAFAGRKIETTEWDTSQNKYLHLPNYENYQKSSFLYNYFRVKQMGEKDFCYLVEGFFDVISLTQAGVNNCLASLGTSLSKQQLNLLKKLKKKIILFLDGDSAGKQATIKLAIALLAQDIECEIIDCSLSLDPDEICQQKQEELVQICQKKKDPYLHILEHFAQAWEILENPQSIASFIRKIANLFRDFPPKIQEFLLEKLSAFTNWDKEEIREVYFAYQSQTKAQEINKEEELLAYCCQNRRYWLIIQQENYFFSQLEYRYLYQLLHNYYTTKPHLEFNLEKLTVDNNSLKEKTRQLQEIIDDNFNQTDPISTANFLKLLQESKT